MLTFESMFSRCEKVPVRSRKEVPDKFLQVLQFSVREPDVRSLELMTGTTD
jgi:hypothetical protein